MSISESETSGFSSLAGFSFSISEDFAFFFCFLSVIFETVAGAVLFLSDVAEDFASVASGVISVLLSVRFLVVNLSNLSSADMEDIQD